MRALATLFSGESISVSVSEAWHGMPVNGGSGSRRAGGGSSTTNPLFAVRSGSLGSCCVIRATAECGSGSYYSTKVLSGARSEWAHYNELGKQRIQPGAQERVVGGDVADPPVRPGEGRRPGARGEGECLNGVVTP